MSISIVQIIASALLAMPVASHMIMKSPPVRYSNYNSFYKKAGKVDYDLNAPLGGPGGTRLPFPCGRPKGPTDTIMKAGESVKWSLAGGATHNGGHCEISLSYDDKTFVSIQTILGNCMKKGKLDYEVTIPANAPSGNATFAWTWVNWTGNREYYMNCADVIIEGSPNGVLTGPKMVEANMPGRPTIPEFENAQTGAELYENRPNISVTGSGVTGPVGPQPPTTPSKPITTVPSRPEPTSEYPDTDNPASKPTSMPNYPKPQPPIYPPVSKPQSQHTTKPHAPKPYPTTEPTLPEFPESTSGKPNTTKSASRKPYTAKSSSMPASMSNYPDSQPTTEPTIPEFPKPTTGNSNITKPAPIPTSMPNYPKPQPTTEPTSPEYPEPTTGNPDITKPAPIPTSMPNYPKPQPTTEPTSPEYPEPTEVPSTGKCEHGKWECNGTDYQVCVWGAWQERRCPETTKCYQVTPFNILCL